MNTRHRKLHRKYEDARDAARGRAVSLLMRQQALRVSNVYGTTGTQGNYSNFVKTKRELDTKAGRDRNRQDREVAHLQVCTSLTMTINSLCCGGGWS